MSETKNRTRASRGAEKTGLQRLVSTLFYGKGEYFDYNLLAVVLILICFGLVMLYSTSSFIAEEQMGDDMHYFRRQALISVAAMAMAMFVSYVDYHLMGRWSLAVYAAAIVLMGLVKTPLGVTSHGARRWLGVGVVQFQPAEVAKIAVILYLAQRIVKMGKNAKSLQAAMILAALGSFQALIAYQFTENLSTAMIIFGIAMGMVFLSRQNLRNSLILVGGLGVVGLVAIRILRSAMANIVVNDQTPFRIVRIVVWLFPEQYADSYAYQSLQALYAIGSGGLFGRGLGNSIQKLGSVPEAQNDFIFSIICEELGIVGGIVVLLFFGYLLYRLYFIAQNAPDMLGALMVSGIFVHIALQVILNVGVVLNILPNTGVSLPFISYGGTSVLFLMMELGIAMSVSRQIKFRDTTPLL